jgi:rare lipoprotein A
MMLPVVMRLTLNFQFIRLLVYILAIGGLSRSIQAQNNYVEEGIASFYHDKFVGRRTANGEIFTQTAMTAAHKSLKLGTWVRVTNLSNNESVVLRINDRMPKSNKRSIDLTYTAAEKLGYIAKGLTRVRIEVIDNPEVTTALPDPGPPAISYIQRIDCVACLRNIPIEAKLSKPTVNLISEVPKGKKRKY